MLLDCDWEPCCWVWAGNLWLESEVVLLYWVPDPGRLSSLKLFEALSAGFLLVNRQKCQIKYMYSHAC